MWKTLFRLVIGITGACEAVLGLSIVFFASFLQHYFSPGVIQEPLYLRILGMMDFFIGVTYFLMALRPDEYRLINRGTSYLRLALSFVFLAEGVWLLEDRTLRLAYQALAIFDFSLFIIQSLYLRRSVKAL